MSLCTCPWFVDAERPHHPRCPQSCTCSLPRRWELVRGTVHSPSCPSYRTSPRIEEERVSVSGDSRANSPQQGTSDPALAGGTPSHQPSLDKGFRYGLEHARHVFNEAIDHAIQKIKEER